MIRVANPGLPMVLLAALLATSCGKRPELESYTPPPGVSWGSVLRDALDLDSLTSPVGDHERSLHFSSASTTGRVILAHLAPKVLGDMDHGFFVDVEEGESWIDATLAEVSGAGMITWIWSANPVGTLRLFVDSKEAPVLETSFQGFLDGSFLPYRPPFSSVTAKGHNLHFPIIHTNYCKLVVRVRSKEELAELFYQVAWNALDPSTTLNAFDAADIARGEALLRELSAASVHRQDEPIAPTGQHVELAPKAAAQILHASEPGTITSIEFAGKSRADLGELWIRIFWDGAAEPAVDCPLYLLAGLSRWMENSTSLPSISRDGVIRLRWPMPFETARVELFNTSARTLSVRYSIDVEPRTTSMRFAVARRSYPGLRTEATNVLPLADVIGRGRVVGCNVVVHARTVEWWGEGDPQILLDSPDAPTWRGTGTEDYFGAAWCSPEVFSHPLRGQSRAEREGDAVVTSLHRYHLLDRLPFHSFATIRSEAWGLAEGSMDYESAVLYYSE